MPTKTKIEWADYVSNPIKAIFEGDGRRKQGHACVKYSEGCAHCWASSFNVRLGTGLEYSKPNLDEVEMYLDDAEMKRLGKMRPRGPYKNQRQRPMIFICDMTDLFGEFINALWVSRIVWAMKERDDMDFIVLTKRTHRMVDMMRDATPKNNIWLGCSVENQRRADERVAAMRELADRGWQTIVSYEPALGPVDWNKWVFLNLIICGAESGPHARPMHPAWEASTRDFCDRHAVNYFFKQWGEYGVVSDLVARGCETFVHRPVAVESGMADYGPAMMVRVGKGLAGHLVNGAAWRRMP